MTVTSEARPDGEVRAGQMTAGEAVTGSVPPTYPRGGDPRRRAVLRERLYLRRRNARAFDAAAGRYGDDLSTAEVIDDTGDYWHDIGMTLGVAERERAGAVHPWRWAA